MASSKRRIRNLDEIWPDLSNGLTQLMNNLNEGFPRKKWMTLYTNVYDYCTTARVSEVSKNKNSGALLVGKELYRRLVEFLVAHMRKLNESAKLRMDESLLHYYHLEWERYTTCIKYINSIFAYLVSGDAAMCLTAPVQNRHWIKRQMEEPTPVPGIYPINILAIVTWRDEFFKLQEPRVTRALLALIEKERCGEQVDTHLLAGVISGYVNLGVAEHNPSEKTLAVYKQHFETPFLEATSAFYRAESSHFIALNPIADYMAKVEQRLAEERRRARQYLHATSEAPLLARADDALVGAHVDALWAAFGPLLAADKHDDLARLYDLLAPRPPAAGLQPLREPFASHVQQAGLAAVAQLAGKGEPDPADYVHTLLRTYDKYRTLVRTAFHADAQFTEGLDKATRRVVNDNAVCRAAKASSKSPELVARYCDSLLRRSPQNADIVQVEGSLEAVMQVFIYIDDQDVFQTFYAKLLAKRLIHGTSASEDLEGAMIGRLKAACGYEFTSKLQCMFTDIATSRELMDTFLTKKEAKSVPIDFSVLVLATNAWPLQASTTNYTLPAALQTAESLFTKYYVKAYSGRKLLWLHQLAKAELKTRYTTSNRAGYTFQCSTYQVGVLLLFNELADGATLTAEQIQTATLLNDNAMRTTLLSLVKTQVLRMTPKPVGGVVNKNHKFALNMAFKSKKTRVLINVPVPQQRKEEAAATHQTVLDDRKLQVQAAIVRIMKTRKKLAHGNLMSEVIQQLAPRFKPKIAVIKRAIDTLIEREYLERVEGEKDMYSYVA